LRIREPKKKPDRNLTIKVGSARIKAIWKKIADKKLNISTRREDEKYSKGSEKDYGNIQGEEAPRWVRKRTLSHRQSKKNRKGFHPKLLLAGKKMESVRRQP